LTAIDLTDMIAVDLTAIDFTKLAAIDLADL